MAQLLTRCIAAGLGAALAAGGVMAACRAVTPVPPSGPHTAIDEPQEVRTPPPEPVRVEVLGERPAPDAVWVDGYWHWTGRRWVWRPGVWTRRPAGAYYAPSALVRMPVPVYESDAGTERTLRGYGMTLLYLPGHWHLADGGVAPVQPLQPPDAGVGEPR